MIQHNGALIIGKVCSIQPARGGWNCSISHPMSTADNAPRLRYTNLAGKKKKKIVEEKIMDRIHHRFPFYYSYFMLLFCRPERWHKTASPSPTTTPESKPANQDGANPFA